MASASDNTVFAVDVESFGSRLRSDSDLVVVRDAVHRVVETACRNAGVPWKRCYHEGTGDGLFVVIPSDVPKRLLSTQLPHELANAVQEHNDTCQEQARIRLRAAVHAGQVQRDAHGVAGAAVNLTFRLLDTRTLRSALANSSGVLAMVASDWFFHDVIRHDPDGDPDAYRRVRVRVKETRGHAWVICPGSRPARARLVVKTAASIATVGGVVMAAAILAPQNLDGGGRPAAEALESNEPPPPSETPDPRTGNTPERGAHRTPEPQPAQPVDMHRGTAPPQPSPAPTSTGTTQPPPPSSSPAPRSDGDPVEEERSVQLSTEPGQESVAMDSWQQRHDRTGDLQVDSTGVFTTLNAQLAVVEDAADPTRDRCRQVQNWFTRVEFTQLHVGSKLCARTAGGRYATLDVNALPDPTASNGRFAFYGRTWEL